MKRGREEKRREEKIERREEEMKRKIDWNFRDV